jgi:uncharacterized membrane protein
MFFLILGVALFFAMHMVPSTSIKAAMVTRLGVMPYKGVFSVISIVAVALIVYGLGEASFQALWTPPVWARSLLISIMPIVSILWVVAEIKNNLKRLVRHPMLIAMVIWGAGHMIANGDLATTLVFASFASFSLLNIFMVNARGTYKAPEPVSMLWDVAAILIGLALYGLLFYFHGSFTGMPLR